MLSAKPKDLIDAEPSDAAEGEDGMPSNRQDIPALGLDLLVDALSAALERQTRQSPMDKRY